jgi:nucleotide-binding universal stress UspA family protein
MAAVAAPEVFVVGAADTETAVRAVDRAAQLAKALNAHLIVVCAFTDSDVEVVNVGSDTFMRSGADEAQALSEQMAAQRGVTHGIVATGVARKGKPDDVILEVARQAQATLIVVGNVRMQGPGRLLGSVANGVAHHAPCDVLVVKTTK